MKSLTFIISLILLLALSLPQAALAKGDGSSTIANDARLGGDNARTRFVADLSKPTDYRIFTLADPYRVIIDLPNVRFKLPQGLGSTGKGLVSAFRYGLFAKGKSRIVIDVVGPVHVEQSFILDANGGKSAKLVVDIVPTDRANFERRRKALYEKRVRESRKAKKASLGSVIEKLARVPKKLGKKRIVIDPGHGGLDPGALSSKGTREKDVVLAFAKVLKKKLMKFGTYDVKLTRSVDVFVPLAERVQIAEDYHASLFISIHADAIRRRLAKKIRGATIYTLSKEGSDLEAQALANKENKSDILAGIDIEPESEVEGILRDLTQRETKNQSLDFASIAYKHMKKKTKFRQNMMRSANFRVLRSAIIPSVLIELGYISNANDEKLLKSPKWQAALATSLSKAVDNFMKTQ
ncbi:MAG: N-acetylmuramoyl-L-alanine amidase [Rhizobiales bacterium]|nr:N-acetylmuramoyl-L-alanine amidase [Hyphomicrobiales bacterium]